MKRIAAFLFLCAVVLGSIAQGDAAQKAKAAVLFDEGKYSEALPLYSQLVSLTPSDHDLNYRLGTCMVHGGGDKDKAVGFLRFAVQGTGITPRAHYEYGRALQVTYRFNDALAEYAKYKAAADKRMLAERPTEAVERQCRNGTQLLSNLKEIEVHNKVEVDRTQFDRFYDLTDMGGRIIAVPEELMSALDKKSGERSFLFKPDKGGTIYFSSYGKDGKTGRDIYSTELLPNGTFAVPRKLAGYINTDQDEDFPYLHPDGKSFYFCSKGHTSMGGYDVFRSTYDRGLDVFGSPENLDFAVNTPDDDMLYIVDPEGKEACFASSRESKQGQVHVYRVSTAQQPLALVILKGQYLSEIDAGDRKAHIVVEDAVTRQQVADVRTGLDGTYVLSLPRSGKYKFMVEAGPGGRTHVGMVEAPRIDGARAYRQELILQNPGGQEKLLIKNYFDEPLPDDLIALALDEIKRRAKLDMTATAPVAQAPVEEEPVGDVMTRAGFAGNITTTQAVQLAADDARELTASAKDLKDQSEAAYTAALQAAVEAERANTAAAQHIRNADATTDDAVKSTEMTEAARERERARTAGLRAKAAMRAGEDLEAEALARQQQAVNAERLSTDLAAAVNANNDASTVQHLTKLKERVDVKTGPNAEVAAHERTRRAMVEKEGEASRALQAAASKRDEETDVVASINRLERERDQTKSKGKKEELDKQITQLKDQLAAMRTETERAFAKAKGVQNETSVMRSQASLMKLLDEGAAPMTGTELTAVQRSELGQRVATIEMSTAALPIDERFEAAIAEEVERQRAVANDWSAGGGNLADNPGNAPTAVRNVEGIDQLAVQRTEAQRAALDKQTTGDRAVGTVAQPVGGQENASTATTGADAGASTTGQENGGTQTTDAGNTISGSGQPGGTSNTGSDAAADAQQQPSGTTVTGGTGTAEVPAQVPPDSLMPSTPDPGATLVTSPDPAQQRFVIENELAELEQLRAGERNKDERAKLEARIADAERRLATLSAEAEQTVVEQTITMQSDTPEVARPATEFDRTMRDEDLISKLFTSYADDRDRSLKLSDPVERANAAYGLELMLVDSLQAETDRQTTLLELAPQRADEILPRVERLRLMRTAHNAEAERYAREAELAQRSAALAANPEEDYAIDNTASTSTRGTFSGTEHVDSYVDPTEDRQFILESPVEFRSNKVKDAAAMREQDIERMVRLEEEIDSLENILGTMPQGKDFDKLRKKTDKLIDDHMIERTEMGERSAFLSDEEYKHANDSLKEVRSDVAKLGLAPDEPLVQLAKQFEEDARTNFTQAQLLRKRADRTEDIVLRDSLFRTAFGKELEALRGLDQAITVNNYLLGGEHQRGQTITYAEVERRMFGPDEPALADNTALATERTQTVDIVSDSLVPSPTGAVDPGAPTNGAGPGTKPTVPGTSTVQPQATSTESTDPAGVSITTTPGVAPLTGAADGTAQRTAPVETPGVFVEHRYDVLAAEALQDAQLFEKSSLAEADRAMALRDSAATAKKRDRESIEKLAVLAQQRSDELHRMSQVSSARYDSLLAARDLAARQAEFDARLKQFYYLSPEEQAMITQSDDHSRYFETRSQAIAQREKASEARTGAASSRELARSLIDQAQGIMTNATGAQGADQQQMAQAASLNDRAVQLTDRADSLAAVAARLDGAADLNENQAATQLQGLSAEKSTAIMALEQRARRTEPMLAEARSAATVEPNTPNDPAVTPGNTVAQQPATSLDVPIGIETRQPAEGSTPLLPATGTGGAGLLPPLEADVFTLLPATGQSRNIVMDGPLPAGLVYKVQIGAFKYPISDELFSDMTPISGETLGNGMVRYMAGMFTQYANADAAKQQVRDRGYRDAFVVAYMDGKRISLAEARTVGGQQGPPAVAQVPSGARAEEQAIARPPQPVLIQPPVTTSTVAQPAPSADVLARYAPTAEAVLEAFKPTPEAAAYYNVPGAAPAKQVETIKGLFFTVQVGVYSKPVALDKLFNITPLNSELTETAKVRYTTGIYLDSERARVRKDAAIGNGVKDAFVTAYLNGKRIPMTDARALLARFGNSVLADTSLATP